MQIRLRQVNPANVLHIDVIMDDLDARAVEIEWRQLTPAGGTIHPRQAASDPIIHLFTGGDVEFTNYRLSGVVYGEGGSLLAAPVTIYNPMGRQRASASGAARSSGTAHANNELPVTASGASTSEGSGRAVSWLALRASGEARSAGQAALGAIGERQISAAGQGRSEGRAGLFLSRPLPIGASGASRSSGRVALLVAGPPEPITATGASRSDGGAWVRHRAFVPRAPRLMRAFPLQGTIARYRAAPRPDEFGDRPPVLVGLEEVRCNLQPTSSRDSSVNEARDTEQFNLYLPSGTEFGGSDHFIFRGEDMVAVGPGLEFADFDGEPHHVEATLRRVV